MTYRTANLQSFILYIYSTNIGTEYFKHGVCFPFFFSSKCSLFHNSNIFGSCIIHILYTGCAKIKKNNSGAKRLSRLFTEKSLSSPCLKPVLLPIALKGDADIPSLKISDCSLWQFHKHNKIDGNKHPELHIFIAISYVQTTLTMKYININL